MTRAFLIVMDSVGIGGAPDAGEFFNGTLPDTGANTLGHIAEWCRDNRAQADRAGQGGLLDLPNLDRLGLGEALRLASGISAPGLSVSAPSGPPAGRWGVATEISPGKDTPSGHWELAGVPVPWDWHYFDDEIPAFPVDLVRIVMNAAGTDGILGNCHASGTEIIQRLGQEHIETGWPICYTSADSVFQIAAHETHFGLDRLLRLCLDIAPVLHDMKVGRVIARPFVGSPEQGFTRTGNRHDYAIAPPQKTLCDWAQEAGRTVQAVGKIGDIFSMRGIDTVVKGSDAELMDHLQGLMHTAPDGSLTFANFVEFDSLFGHRRDPAGYARALEWFDRGIKPVLDGMRDGDMVVLTADHGNDPTWPGSDHTRERVPVLVAGCGVGQIGHVGFVDVAASIAAHLGLDPAGPGRSFL